MSLQHAVWKDHTFALFIFITMADSASLCATTMLVASSGFLRQRGGAPYTCTMAPGVLHCAAILSAGTDASSRSGQLLQVKCFLLTGRHAST